MSGTTITFPKSAGPIRRSSFLGSAFLALGRGPLAGRFERPLRDRLLARALTIRAVEPQEGVGGERRGFLEKFRIGTGNRLEPRGSSPERAERQ